MLTSSRRMKYQRPQRAATRASGAPTTKPDRHDDDAGGVGHDVRKRSRQTPASPLAQDAERDGPPARQREARSTPSEPVQMCSTDERDGRHRGARECEPSGTLSRGTPSESERRAGPCRRPTSNQGDRLRDLPEDAGRGDDVDGRAQHGHGPPGPRPNDRERREQCGGHRRAEAHPEIWDVGRCTEDAFPCRTNDLGVKHAHHVPHDFEGSAKVDPKPLEALPRQAQGEKSRPPQPDLLPGLKTRSPAAPRGAGARGIGDAPYERGRSALPCGAHAVCRIAK